MVLGYAHNLVKGKSDNHELGKTRLRRIRGRDVNVTCDEAMVNTMFIRNLFKHNSKHINAQEHDCTMLNQRQESIVFIIMWHCKLSRKLVTATWHSF